MTPSAVTLVSQGAVGLATWAASVVVLAVPLVLMGVWTPAPAALVIGAGLVVGVAVARRTPVAPAPAPAALAIVLVAVAAGVWAGATRAEHLVLRRDAGTYAMAGQHLAQAGTTVVDVAVARVGGAGVLALPGVTVGSPGFYQQGSGAGTHVVPQFLVATPVWLSVGWWAGGWTGLLLVPALTLGAGLLAFGALAIRLVGGWWAVPATAALALAQPVLHAGRSTYSEPLALLLGCAGAAVLVDALAAGAGGRRLTAGRLALLAGLLLGGMSLVRVDALREVALLLPVAALSAVQHIGVAGRLLRGLAVSVGLAAVAGLAFSRPYLAAVAGSLVPLVAGTLGLAVTSAAVVLLARRGVRLPPRVRERLPQLLAVAAAAVGVLLATRPWWQVVRQSPADPGSRVVAGLQLRQGLPVDGGRTYAEQSVQWVTWWLGVPVVLLALAGALALAYRAGLVWRDGDPLPPWSGPALVAAASTVLILYRPGITPDHPWADRRLVPVVLPAVVLFATAAIAGGLRRWGPRLPPPGRVAVGFLGVALLVVPAALATAPVATQRTERGEVAAVQAACQAFGPNQTAVLIDPRAANEWTQVLRGVCDVPTVVVRSTSSTPADAATVIAVAEAVLAAGRTPVVVSAGSAEAISRLGAVPRKVVSLVTVEDQRLLVWRPDGGARLDVELWIAPAT